MNNTHAGLSLVGIAGVLIAVLLLYPSYSDDTIILFSGEGGNETPVPCDGNVGLILAQNLTDLCDVTITNPLTNQTVFYNGSQWINVFFGSNSTGCSDLDCLTDVTIINVDNNNVLQYNETSSQWENRGTLYNTTISMDGQSIFFNTSLDNYEFLVDGNIMTLRQNENVQGSFYIFGGNSGTEPVEFALFGDGNSFDIMSTVGGFEIFINANQYTFPNNSGQLLTDVNVVDGIGIEVLQSGDDVIINTKFANGTGISITGTDTLTFTNTAPDNTVCANVGSGTVIYKDGECNFKTLIGSSDISITNTTNTVIIDYNGTHVTSVTSNNNNTIGVVPTSGNVVLYPKYQLLCQTTLGSANATISCNGFTAMKHLHIEVFARANGGTGIEPSIRFNGDTGNNYSIRGSSNGGADATTTATSRCILTAQGALTPSGDTTFSYTDIYNNLTSERKLSTGESVRGVGTSSGTAPIRAEQICKWDNTTAQITSITAISFSGTGNFNTSSQLTVWGYD